MDDAPHGVDAAITLGMRAVLVDRSGERPPAPAGRPAVTSLDETACAPTVPSRRPTTRSEASQA